MSDLDIINEYGSIYIEPRGEIGNGKAKGVLIYVETKEQRRDFPPNHLALNEHETLKLIKWLVGYLNEVEIVGK